MPGLVPGIRVFARTGKAVIARDKREASRKGA
jgi:hypothetical protein